jgi:hypothetical protein
MPDTRCLACGRDANATPLVRLDYMKTEFWICPQHLPLLIHHPEELIGKLPGAEKLQAAEHHD